jgi:hypothetical protein
MTETNLAALLERTVDGAQIGSPPIAQMVTDASRHRRRRTLTMLGGGCAAAVAIVVGVATVTSPGGVPSTPPPAASTSGAHGDLTDQEYQAAVDLARQQLRTADGTVTTVTVTVSVGTVTDSNVGYPCESGRLLNIKLIGTFPHIATGGLVHLPGMPAEDSTVHAVVLTADAETGRACLIGVQTGDVKPEPGAVVLDLG